MKNETVLVQSFKGCAGALLKSSEVRLALGTGCEYQVILDNSRKLNYSILPDVASQSCQKKYIYILENC